MKLNLKIFIVCALVIAFSGLSFGQNFTTYKHPSLNIQLRAAENWKHIPRPEDRLIYEITDAESVVHVLMWYTETEQNGSAYIKKMAGMKDLVYQGEPTKGKINNRDAWVLDATCCMNESPVRVVLVAIPYETDKEALFITQIWCPEDKFAEKEQKMEDIIYSLEITE